MSFAYRILRGQHTGGGAEPEDMETTESKATAVLELGAGSGEGEGV